MKRLLQISEGVDIEGLVTRLSKSFDKITMKTDDNGNKVMILEQSETKTVLEWMDKPVIWFKWGR